MQLLLRNYAVDFVEICNIYIGKMIIKAAKRIFNSDKICRSYSDLNFGVTFFGTQCSFDLIKYLRNTTRSSASNERSLVNFRDSQWSQCIGDLLYCWS